MQLKFRVDIKGVRCRLIAKYHSLYYGWLKLHYIKWTKLIAN